MPRGLVLFYVKLHEFSYFLLNAVCDVGGVQLLAEALVSCGDLDYAVLEVSRAYDNAERDSQQVGVGEHYACAYCTVVVDHLYAALLELLVECVCLLLDLGVVGAYCADVHLPRSDSHRPDGP